MKRLSLFHSHFIPFSHLTPTAHSRSEIIGDFPNVWNCQPHAVGISCWLGVVFFIRLIHALLSFFYSLVIKRIKHTPPIRPFISLHSLTSFFPSSHSLQSYLLVMKGLCSVFSLFSLLFSCFCSITFHSITKKQSKTKKKREHNFIS